MNEGGDCVSVPDFVDSMSTCGGEYIGTESGEDHYNDIVLGGCNDP